MITHGIIPQCQSTFRKITHGKITQYDYPWCYTPVSNYILKDYPGLNTKGKSLSMIIHSILAKCRTTLWNIIQGPLPGIKSLCMITHGIIPQCHTILWQITQGKITKGKVTLGFNYSVSYPNDGLYCREKNMQAKITKENYPRWIYSGLSRSWKILPIIGTPIEILYKEYIWTEQIGN